MDHSIKHKCVTPSHIWYFRTDSRFQLIIEIPFFVLHIQYSPLYHPFCQITVIAKFVQSRKCYEQLSRTMNVNGKHAIIVILRRSILFKKVLDIIVKSFLYISFETLVTCHFLISDKCIQIIPCMKTIQFCTGNIPYTQAPSFRRPEQQARIVCTANFRYSSFEV